nr:hypothetical protein [Tanacetum cinerariifolium]
MQGLSRACDEQLRQFCGGSEITLMTTDRIHGRQVIEAAIKTTYLLHLFRLLSGNNLTMIWESCRGIFFVNIQLPLVLEGKEVWFRGCDSGVVVQMVWWDYPTSATGNEILTA